MSLYGLVTRRYVLSFAVHKENVLGQIYTVFSDCVATLPELFERTCTPEFHHKYLAGVCAL